MKKIGHPPDGPVLAFSPDAKTLAVGGTGRTVLLDLTSGEVWAVAAPLVTPGKEKVITLRAYTLPHPEVQAKIDKKLARPGVFALRPGDAVRIDVSALPADRRAEARAALDRQAKAVGYRPAPGAAVALVGTANATGPKRPATYHFWTNRASERIEHVERHARLKVVWASDGRVLHQAEASHPALFVIHLKPGQTAADQAATPASRTTGCTTANCRRWSAVRPPSPGAGVGHLHAVRRRGPQAPARRPEIAGSSRRVAS